MYNECHVSFKISVCVHTCFSIVLIYHYRADREKSILQGKLRMVQKNIIESSGRPQLVSSGRSMDKEATPTTSADGTTLSSEERHQLKSRIYQLESEVHLHVIL